MTGVDVTKESSEFQLSGNGWSDYEYMLNHVIEKKDTIKVSNLNINRGMRVGGALSCFAMIRSLELVLTFVCHLISTNGTYYCLCDLCIVIF